MKARITKSNSDIILSVGMIVKNEEKGLNKCLTALKRLLDAVPSELIIVDTGSADKTVEIAKRFTSHVHHFDWVGSFSAARNVSLEHSRGEWFMYIDADDILDNDISEMVEFFNDERERRRYNSATYMTQDYTVPDGSEWIKFTQFRIVKRFPGLKFVHTIHEEFSDMPHPQKNFKTFAHHWGYAFESEEAREAKRQRNLTALNKELGKNPGDLRIAAHIWQELFDEEKAAHFSSMLTTARKQPDNPYAMGVFFRNISQLYDAGEHEKVISSIDEFIKPLKGKPKNMFCLDLYVLRALTLFKQGKPEEAKEAYEAYFRLYKEYIAGNLSPLGVGIVPITYSEPEKYAAAKAAYDELLWKLNGGSQNNLSLSAGTSMNVAVASVGSGTAENAPDFSDVCENDRNAVLAAIQNNTDITEVIRDIKGDKLSRIIEKLAQDIHDLPQKALGYNEQFFFTGVKNLLFGVTLYERAVTQAGRLPWHERSVLYRNFARYAALYTANVYNPELLNETDLDTLPQTHRFGFFMGAAQKELDAGNKSGYIAELKKALTSCEGMADIIKLFIEEL